MRVVFVGDYPLDVGLRKHGEGLYPSHNLFGLVELPALGVQTLVVKHCTSVLLDKVARRLGLGNSICSQWNVLCAVQSGDIVFATSLPSGGLLALAKRLGLMRNRLVTLVHHPSKPSFVERFILRANDRLFFFSQNGMNSCRRLHGLQSVPMAVLPWGPQQDFYATTPLPGGALHVVAAGKSSRDYRTMVEAARRVDVRVTIVCPRNRFPALDLPPNVTLIGGADDSQPLEERELSDLYDSAHLIAVPLVRTEVLAGLTSLLDALAIHRPVAITRNPNIDIDVESEAVGFWTEPEDVDSWVRVFEMARSDRARLQLMSVNAARVCREKLDIHRFVAELKAELVAMQ